MNYYSLNQVVNLCEQIADAHKQINGFRFGEPYNVATITERYPLLWARVGSAAINGKTLSLNISLYIIDILSDDYSNEKDIMSDTLSIAQDVVAMLQDPALSGDLVIGENIILEPLFEELPDKVNGWRVDVPIELSYLSNRCQVPSDWNITPTPSCEPSIVELNGQPFLILPSGSETNVLLKDTNNNTVTPISVIGTTITIPASGSVILTNSDASYTNTIAAPSTFVLPDTEYEVYVDGNLQASFSVPTLKDETINIVWQ